MNKFIGALLLVAMFSTPFGVFAADYEDEEYSGRSYSRSIQKKVKALDDDAVKEISIPVLFGVSMGDLYPNFGDPRDGGARKHQGFDILAPEWTPIVTPTEAVVLRTGTGRSSGKYVYTANPGGETFAYMHLVDVAGIRAGDLLQKGDVIGYVGDTGNAKGGVMHLHFEIRKNRKALDPYKRIEQEFTLKEKMSYLDTILEDVKDEDDYIEFLLSEFKSEFTQAKISGVDIPEDVEKAMGTAVGGTPTADLELGAKGDDVLWLQTKLIQANAGAKAKELAKAGATGLFGPLTRAALIEYQKEHNISPASGYFGQLTRAHMKK